MKIGLVCPYNITKGGGVQEVVKALQAGLIERGHEAVIISFRPRGYKGKPKNTILLGLGGDWRSPIHTTTQVSVSVETKEIETMLANEQFDILHFHEPWVPVLSRQILSKSTSVNVATFHARLPETMMTRTLAKVVTPYTKSVLKYIDSFTAVSEAAQEYLRSLSDPSVTIIPNGIDLQNFHVPRHKAEKKDKTILYIGRLEKRKGVEYLLKSFAELEKRHKHVKLVIAGDGVDRQKLELLTAELRLKNVKFLGYITEKRKKQLLRDADLFCAPAIYGESFGIVLLEAMASGLITVAGNNPGYSTVLQGLGGLSLANPKDTSEFANRIDLLLHEPQLQKLWLDWAKKTVRQYDYPNVVKLYEQAYNTALEERQ
jgi:phosphatidyl-myo-inositol alpha-mannosyltransferase